MGRDTSDAPTPGTSEFGEPSGSSMPPPSRPETTMDGERQAVPVIDLANIESSDSESDDEGITYIGWKKPPSVVALDGPPIKSEPSPIKSTVTMPPEINPAESSSMSALKAQIDSSGSIGQKGTGKSRGPTRPSARYETVSPVRPASSPTTIGMQRHHAPTEASTSRASREARGDEDEPDLNHLANPSLAVNGIATGSSGALDSRRLSKTAQPARLAVDSDRSSTSAVHLTRQHVPNTTLILALDKDNAKATAVRESSKHPQRQPVPTTARPAPSAPTPRPMTATASVSPLQVSLGPAGAAVTPASRTPVDEDTLRSSEKRKRGRPPGTGKLQRLARERESAVGGSTPDATTKGMSDEALVDMMMTVEQSPRKSTTDSRAKMSGQNAASPFKPPTTSSSKADVEKRPLPKFTKKTPSTNSGPRQEIRAADPSTAKVSAAQVQVNSSSLPIVSQDLKRPRNSMTQGLALQLYDSLGLPDTSDAANVRALPQIPPASTASRSKESSGKEQNSSVVNQSRLVSNSGGTSGTHDVNNGKDANSPQRISPPKPPLTQKSAIAATSTSLMTNLAVKTGPSSKDLSDPIARQQLQNLNPAGAGATTNTLPSSLSEFVAQQRLERLQRQSGSRLSNADSMTSLHGAIAEQHLKTVQANASTATTSSSPFRPSPSLPTLQTSSPRIATTAIEGSTSRPANKPHSAASHLQNPTSPRISLDLFHARLHLQIAAAVATAHDRQQKVPISRPAAPASPALSPSSPQSAQERSAGQPVPSTIGIPISKVAAEIIANRSSYALTTSSLSPTPSTFAWRNPLAESGSTPAKSGQPGDRGLPVLLSPSPPASARNKSSAARHATPLNLVGATIPNSDGAVQRMIPLPNFITAAGKGAGGSSGMRPTSTNGLERVSDVERLQLASTSRATAPASMLSSDARLTNGHRPTDTWRQPISDTSSPTSSRFVTGSPTSTIRLSSSAGSDKQTASMFRPSAPLAVHSNTPDPASSRTSISVTKPGSTSTRKSAAVAVESYRPSVSKPASAFTVGEATGFGMEDRYDPRRSANSSPFKSANIDRRLETPETLRFLAAAKRLSKQTESSVKRVDRYVPFPPAEVSATKRPTGQARSLEDAGPADSSRDVSRRRQRSASSESVQSLASNPWIKEPERARRDHSPSKRSSIESYGESTVETVHSIRSTPESTSRELPAAESADHSSPLFTPPESSRAVLSRLPTSDQRGREVAQWVPNRLGVTADQFALWGMKGLNFPRVEARRIPGERLLSTERPAMRQPAQKTQPRSRDSMDGSAASELAKKRKREQVRSANPVVRETYG